MQEQGSLQWTESEDSARRDLQGFVSATRELQDACSNLSPGQMVSVPDFTLLDSMAALQLMDARMDSGIFPIPDHLVADCDKVKEGVQMSPFDPNMRLSVADVCWIMDRIWACELEWHKGASLSQTIHTSLYIHSLASLRSSPSDLDTRSSSTWIVSMILRPFLIAVLKSVGMVWDEMSRGNLLDGEDFNGDKVGVSLLEEVSPADAIMLMQESILAVNESREQGVLETWAANSLSSRLQLRKSFLECIFIFAKVDPTLRLGQNLDPMQTLNDLSLAVENAQQSLLCLDDASTTKSKDIDMIPFQPPTFSASPSSKAISAFDPWYSRRPSLQNTYNAPSAPPPPLPLQLMSSRESIVTIRQLLAGFLEVKELVNECSWLKWKSFIDQKALQFQQKRTLPYIRSLWQSFFCSENIVGIRYTLDWLSDSFLLDTAGVRPRHLTFLTTPLPANGGHKIQNSPVDASISSTRLTRSLIDDFLSRLSGQLVNHLSSLAQNRSRGKRRLAAAYESLLELSMQAAAIDDNLQEEHPAKLPPFLRFAPPVQLLTLDTMEHIVLSGFELELYSLEEFGIAYWIAQRIAEEKAEVLKSIIRITRVGTDSVTHLLPDLDYTECIAKACSAMQNLILVPFSTNGPGIMPWIPLKEDLSVVPVGRARATETNLFAEQKVTFFKRYKWLRGKGRPESAQTLESLWQAYISHIEMLKARSRRQRLDDAIADLQSALRLPTTTGRIPIQLHLLLRANLQKILQACLDDDEQQSTPHCIIPLSFTQHDHEHHPWFPIPITNLKPLT